MAGDVANGSGVRSSGHLVPSSVDEVTPRWLTSVLRGAGAATGVVGEMAATRIGAGKGLLGSLWRMDLAWVDGGGPVSVVAKLPAEGANSRAVATAMGMYTREVRFYGDLGPGTGVAVPCHHAAVDPRTHDFVLILGDLTAATTVDQLGGCPVGRAEQVVATLAALHAHHWGERGLEHTPWLTPLAGSSLADEIAGAARTFWPGVRERFGDDLPADALAVGDDVADRVRRAADALSQPPVTLAHGDVRLDNVFFDAGTVRLCDWQLTGRSRGARDLAYFLTQSLTPDMRAAHEPGLVAQYLDRLRRLDVDPGDEHDFWRDYAEAVVLGFAYGIVASGGLDQDGDRAAAIPRAMLTRSARAIVDHRSGA